VVFSAQKTAPGVAVTVNSPPIAVVRGNASRLPSQTLRGFRGSRKSTPLAAQVASSRVGEIIKDYGEVPLIGGYPGKLNQVYMNLPSINSWISWVKYSISSSFFKASRSIFSWMILRR